MSRLNCSRPSFLDFFLWKRRSEIVKITKRIAVKDTPEIVAILFEMRLATATKNSTSVVTMRPNGISRPAIVILPGVLYS